MSKETIADIASVSVAEFGCVPIISGLGQNLLMS